LQYYEINSKKSIIIASYLKRLLFQRSFNFFVFASAVNIIMTSAKLYIEPSYKYVYSYMITNNMLYNKFLNIIHNFVVEGYLSHELAIKVTQLYILCLCILLVLALVCAAVLITIKSCLRLIQFILNRKNYYLQTNVTLFQEIKLIVIWIPLYAICNWVVLMLGLPDFWYKTLALLSQTITLYWLLYYSSIDYKIINKISKSVA